MPKNGGVLMVPKAEEAPFPESGGGPCPKAAQAPVC